MTGFDGDDDGDAGVTATSDASTDSSIADAGPETLPGGVTSDPQLGDDSVASAAGLVARNAYDYAQSIIHYSTNKWYSIPYNILEFYGIARLFGGSISAYRYTDECSAFPVEQRVYSNDSFFRAVVHFATSSSIGNCGEYACLAADYIRKSGVAMDVHIMTWTDGDHNWVVTNLGAGADPNDRSTWGNDAWVIDGWKKEFFKYDPDQYDSIFGSHHCACDTSW